MSKLPDASHVCYFSEQAENDLEDLYAYAEALTVEISVLKVQLFTCILPTFCMS